ncbi:3-hydroxyacyl-ACP dehydratase FabZ [Pseudidiomarina terrestris]|uniref:3-hydroxyacyl-[acyl-carrier-protein] dehydratase FabZ n=1 Tax=Pseudidiomarina terrestris TaxID=2820060 RepID=A0AAW7QTR9_9GAMM|nr:MULTISPECIES: 3-hydroxyacyl-ACP dehydratase FabZ [unclassified Pseudidiomarina]MDN7123562.1 3-hydroxyacyl-ACP dehydratase FabZ [Pseudidiomarina sp. 1APP75-32.1]MDN7126648.1 3-hydroxyacyl-ACP dehydratase FabZ [Pseudidiomarina sp. 1APR75-33.1]MDN7128714.1 3-hydroxyacyl-ACP dehydratase FabZ [Pseudidiomarina sp. 1APR75-15]MDN7135027.1 3-hydroxyacyl-ACP dehydratase FabZ [Pseudidiomarina sp. 1ASP75-5]MDN7137698.1 3-hydroxyacyl-ACP dehydratase FabZ [Pseudidiomarina sp. 1ASP75-14]
MSVSDSAFNIQEVMRLLPHRYPFLLVDKVVSCDAQTKIHAVKNITVNENLFTGHFPGNPIFPGVLILEALAQAAGLLGFKITESKPGANDLYLFAGVDNARFKRQVLPGDALHLHVTFEKERRGIWVFKGRAEVDGELACSADIICARRET